MNLISELTAFGRFARGLPAFLGETMDLDRARSIVSERLANRGTNFLSGLKRSVFGRPGSPYARLMELAGCAFADAEVLVRDRGLEGALHELKDGGVYVTFEEFKGHRPIVRGGREIETLPGDFDNPELRQFFTTTTGGSTGAPRRVLMDLEHFRSRLPMQVMRWQAHGLGGAPFAQWAEIPPGHGLEAALLHVVVERFPERWFTPIWAGTSGPGLRFRLATQAAVMIARRSGADVPRPEFVPLDSAHVVAEWAVDAIGRAGRCVLRTHMSKALRVAVAAQERGWDLTGLLIESGGEPATPAKVERILASGASLVSNYFLMEAGPIGFGCPDSEDANDQHFQMDHLAMITSPRSVPASGESVNAFLYTTLLPTAPKLLINVETDDYGVVEQRSCGCLLGELGFDTHIRDIRSFSKLTGEGVTLIGSDMVDILERDLPARFGGSPLDYQLVEEEDDSGFTRLTLLVHPRLDVQDDAALVDAVHEGLSRRGGAAAFTRTLWTAARTLRVRREEPRLNARGKLWPLHSDRRTTSALGGGESGSPDVSST